MAPPRRASERARAGVGLTGERPRTPRLSWVLALAATSAFAACRQTVVLDPSALADAGAVSGAAGAAGSTHPGGHMSTADAAVDGGDGGNGGGNHFDGGHPDGVGFCSGGQIQPLAFMMRTPDVVFSVDRSSAMQSWFGTGSRLQVIQSQVDALVAKYQKVVRFGYEEFPSTTGMCSAGQGCCAGPVTPPTLNALKWIDNVLMNCNGNNGMGTGGIGGNLSPGCMQAQRPTADALTRCDKTFSTFPDSGDRYLILLTGGDPSCMGSDPMSTPCTDAVTAITKLNRESILTAIFGVGDEAVGSTCLDQLALAGGLDSGGASPLYHLARTPTDLSAALSPVIEIMAEQACQIDVRSPPVDPNNVSLLFDGVPVPIDGVDGWTFAQGSTVKITIQGSYCDTLIQRSPRVDLVSGCASPHH